MIPKQTIQDIIDTSRIEEVVGDFVQLKKRGANMLGLCPFHQEKTPSFTVSPSKGFFKCFGCGKGGNSVIFLMEAEQYTYLEALKYLAKKYNIAIEEKEQTPAEIQAQNEREVLFNITAFAQKYLADVLWNNDEGKAIGLSYFKERGFTEETIKAFGLGYSVDRWDDFTKHALENGYKKESLIQAGFSIEKEEKIFDRFRGRVMFPIYNVSGRAIGFGGRILKKEDNKAKYVNSPESEIYHKSGTLYGLSLAKNHIVNKEICYLVEGYTDVISLYQAGIKNVVASSGTSLTTDQIRLIKRYTKNITILYDGDAAGIKASFRGIDMIVEEGLNVKIVLFSEGDDPDSFARKNRVDEIESFLQSNQKDFINFKTSLLLDETAHDPIKKAGLIKEIVNTISLISDGITRSIYVKECSNLLDIQEQVLHNELNKVLRNKLSTKQKTLQNELEQPTEINELIETPAVQQNQYEETDAQEKELIRILLNYGTQNLTFKQLNEDNRPEEIQISTAEFIVNELTTDELKFEHTLYQVIFETYISGVNSNNLPTTDFFINHAEKEISNLTVDMVSDLYTLSNNWEDKHNIVVKTESNVLQELTVNSVYAFKLKKIEDMIHQLHHELKTADENDMFVILEKKKQLDQVKKTISSQLGRIIIR